MREPNPRAEQRYGRDPKHKTFFDPTCNGPSPRTRTSRGSWFVGADGVGGGYDGQLRRQGRGGGLEHRGGGDFIQIVSHGELSDAGIPVRNAGHR
jgi:hypothetical protein